MLELEPITVSRLNALEMGQLVKSTLRDIRTLDAAQLSNPVLTSYLTKLDTAVANFDKGTLQVTKNEQTIKIENADKVRDRAITCTQRLLSVFEFSDNEAELDAFASLSIVFNTYKGLQNWNYEEETNGIDNFVNELTSTKYKAQVTLLQMDKYVTRMKTSNDAFKLIFSKRNMVVSSKETFDMKQLRAELKITYANMTDYVFVMLKNDPTSNLTAVANTINTIRKYYADLLAKRKPSKDDEGGGSVVA
jgi:hypothetical protein